MQINQNTKLGDIVAENYNAASIFDKYQLDFCCQGDRSIEQACKAQNLPLEEIMEEVRASTQSSNSDVAGMPTDIKAWPLDLMADYVEKKHHRYVTQQIPVIEAYLDKIVRVHGGNHPELATVREIFQETAGELTMHMKKEELMLFPYIRKMVLAKISGRKLDPPPFGSISNPVNAMLADHEMEGARSAKLRALTNGFQTPADGCNTYRLTWRLLEDFEKDLHQHIHIENNILFPRAIELETTGFVSTEEII